MQNEITKNKPNILHSVKRFFPYLTIPLNLKVIMLSILPVILAQILQKIYPIIDNHFIGSLGSEALLIHNIQFSFISLGQYIGSATAISCLIFWDRHEYKDRQSAILSWHIFLCLISSITCLFIATLFTKSILAYFSVNTEYYSVAKSYFILGLINMVLQAVFTTLIGVTIAAKKEKFNLVFSFILLIFNYFLDSFAIHFFFSGTISPNGITKSLLFIALSSTITLASCAVILFRLVSNKTITWRISNVKEILSIWISELGGAFISGVYPILYIFQLGAIKSNGSILITYQLIMQIAGVLCIPLLSTMQIALREASAEKSVWSLTNTPKWLRKLLYFGFLPTIFFLVISLFTFSHVIYYVFGYQIPSDQYNYIILFLIASIIGQVGNLLTVPIRASKRSHLVTTSYFISDVIIMLGGMEIIILFHYANPTMVGLITLLYTIVYALINLFFVTRSK